MRHRLIGLPLKGMAGNTETGPRGCGSRWRVAAWATAAALVLLPLLAMQISDEVTWNLADFVLAGALVAGVGLTYELALRFTRNRAYRAAAGLALAATFILVWINLAVGIIGSEDNAANLMYGGVLAVGVTGAVAARFRAYGMALALAATALAQMAVAAITLIAGLNPARSRPLEIVTLNGFFAALWLTSAWLFRKASR